MLDGSASGAFVLGRSAPLLAEERSSRPVLCSRLAIADSTRHRGRVRDRGYERSALRPSTLTLYDSPT